MPPNTDKLGAQNRPEPEPESPQLPDASGTGGAFAESHCFLDIKSEKKHLGVLIFNAVRGKRTLAESLNLVDYKLKD